MEDSDQQSKVPTSDQNERRAPPQQSAGHDRTETVGMAVISTVAARADTDPVELDSLYSVVNPDALDVLFQPGTDGQVTFTYNGYDVVVHSDGGIEVNEADE